MNIEQSYQEIANLGLYVYDSEPWDSIIIKCKVFDKMTTYSLFKVLNGEEFRAPKLAPFNLSSKACEALLLLRDNLLESTGQRIWGLTMNIDNSGRFNIEYIYEKEV